MARVAMAMLILLLVGPINIASGHPPSEVHIDFEVAEHLLRVSVIRSVNDSLRHYVDRILVELNEEKIIEQRFKSQRDSTIQRVEYTIIDARPGDEITVTARCNISGQKKTTLRIEQNSEQQDAREQSSKGH